MTAQRHPPTVLLQGLPNKALVGVDLLSLTASTRFGGITALPAGWHFLFVGANESFSSRQGLWFYVPNPDKPEDIPLHAGNKRPRSDSQVLGVRGQQVIEEVQIFSQPHDWLAVLCWNTDLEQLEPVRDGDRLEEWRSRLLSSPDLQGALFPYRQSVPPAGRVQELDDRQDDGSDNPIIEPTHDFPSLAEHMSASTLSRICGSEWYPFWMLDTASSTRADAEAEKIPGLAIDESMAGRPLNLLNIDLKQTWPPDAVGRERTEAARDRSWRLGEVTRQASSKEQRSDDVVFADTVMNHGMETDGQITEAAAETTAAEPVSEWGHSVLGELEFSFVVVLSLANWSCLAHWRRILELCLTCERAVCEHSGFFVALFRVLELQLRHMSLVEAGLFDYAESSMGPFGGNGSGGAGSGSGSASDGGGGPVFLRRLLIRFARTLAELESDDQQYHDGQEQDQAPQDASMAEPVAATALRQVQATFGGVRRVASDLWGWHLGVGTSTNTSTNPRRTTTGHVNESTRGDNISDPGRITTTSLGLRVPRTLRQGTVQLEDGELVELDMFNGGDGEDDDDDAADETGEYAPVVVSMVDDVDNGQDKHNANEDVDM